MACKTFVKRPQNTDFNSLGQPFNKSVNITGTETTTSTFSTLNLTFYPKSIADEYQKNTVFLRHL